ncbi:hypothetical protein [Oceanivirga salmonicida]|uniref:hypothetical protein n=1 Tax=Oceanivirga salmonicida TaxID=1769291 RepID=UPI000834A694|nr:hypothetical protein [Oceanivirga salmonicida]
MIKFKTEIDKGNKYIKGLFCYLIIHYDYYCDEYQNVQNEIKNIDLLVNGYKSPTNITNDRVMGGKRPLNSLEIKENKLKALYKQKDQLFDLINLIDDTVNSTCFRISKDGIKRLGEPKIRKNTEVLNTLLNNYPYNKHLA